MAISAAALQSNENSAPLRRPRTVVVANQKGGVGKTTTTVNLATAVAAIRKRALVIDLDPQGNASTGLGLSADKRIRGTYAALMNECSIDEAIQPTSIPNLFVLPATVDLAGAEIELVTMAEREFKLKRALAGLHTSFDIIFIDCPPSLNMLTLNALAAADSVLVPLQCEFYALEGLSFLIKTVERVKRAFNPRLEIDGVLLTMYDRRNNLCDDVARDVRGFLGPKVFDTVIPRNVRISEAPSHGLPVLVYDHRSAGSQAYMQLAKEVIRRFPLEAAA